MGVKGLWMVLTPIAERKSLWELKDQTIAIDLSGWICENQCVDNCNLNLYLKNLFFRTSCLLLLGIKPIFVLDGRAPSIKFDAIKRRRNIHRNHFTDKDMSRCQNERRDRSRLDIVQKQCEELLTCLGVPCYYSDGEAEAFCAILNERGIVNGVITQDSDCFLYGAQTVYKNFSITSNGGCIEIYELPSLENKLSLGRNKLVALSLLCGCDYNDKGVVGIGKESALKFLATVSDSEVLERISSWRANSSDSDETNDLPRSMWEINLKRKALQNPRFPFPEVQKEFLQNDMNVSHVMYEWKRPNMKNFVMLAERKFKWKTDYSMEKFLPLLARWHLTNGLNDKIVELDFIVKKRKLRNVPSYEIKWKDFSCTTVEPLCLLQLKYQLTVTEFERSKSEVCKKWRKRPENQKNGTKTEICAVADQLGMLSLERVERIEENSLTMSDFECSVSDLPELSSIVESITGVRQC